jgi:hypothetical protein
MQIYEHNLSKCSTKIPKLYWGLDTDTGSTRTFIGNIIILNLWVKNAKKNRKLREKNPATGTIQYRDDSDTGTGNGRNRNF